MYKKSLLLAMSMTLGTAANAQYFTAEDTLALYGIETENELTGIKALDYTTLTLPPLSVLFENARTNARVQKLSKDKEIEEANLQKQRWSLLKYFNMHGSYSYGVMDNYGSGSDVATPIYYQYVGSKQHYWNVGANVNVPLDDFFEFRRNIKRQRLKKEQASLLVEEAYDQLKLEIVQLYVRINNNIVALRTASENASAYKAAGTLTNQEFINGKVTVRDLAETRRWENAAVGTYQQLQSTITIDILTLEILTHTPIITNILSETQYKTDN